MNKKNLSWQKRRLTLLGSAGIALLTSLGCTPRKSIPSADVQGLLQGKPDSTAVSKALASNLALQINLKTNRVTLYRSGKAVDQWNVASADVTGEFHDKVPQSTPTGIFAVEDMQACPVWLPKSPKNPATGKLAADEKERQEIFKNNPEIFGPCGAKNPLGQYVIWFNGEYGVHGNAAEWILELQNPEERRVSGGCIRNPNEKIKDLFHLVLDSFSNLAAFKNQVTAVEGSAVKTTLTQSLASVDMKVVVGQWAADPAVVGKNSKDKSTDKDSASSGSQGGKKPRRCIVSAVVNDWGYAPTYSSLPAADSNIESFYNLGDQAFVQEDVTGTPYVKTVRGFLERKYLGSCQSQN
ncbi:MAG: hypothetical protein RIR26_1626 [Pseudomonadota bacterium]|jgi:lipoprotein-anchoring transpeptidase ErfK/SrfK